MVLCCSPMKSLTQSAMCPYKLRKSDNNLRSQMKSPIVQYWCRFDRWSCCGVLIIQVKGIVTISCDASKITCKSYKDIEINFKHNDLTLNSLNTKENYYWQLCLDITWAVTELIKYILYAKLSTWIPHLFTASPVHAKYPIVLQNLLQWYIVFHHIINQEVCNTNTV